MTGAPNPATVQVVTIVDELARLGVTDAVLAPGSRSTPLALAFHAEPRIRLHVQIDERSAAFLALGLAKAGGRPVPVFCTSGTAAANFHPAVVEAHQSRVPLLVLTADRPPELRGTAANQTIDQVKLYASSVRWFAEVGTAGGAGDTGRYWRAVTARAYATSAGAVGGPAGPVHLNLAFREPLVPAGHEAPTGRRPGNQPRVMVPRRRRLPDPGDVDWLAGYIGETEKGLLVLGDGAAPCPGDSEALLGLADAAGWPVLAEPTSNARCGPSVISTAHLLLSATGFAEAHRPDVVVTAGKVGLSRPTLALLDDVAGHVLIDPDGAWLDPARSVSRIIAADAGATAEATALRLPARAGGSSPWLDGWAEAERRALDRVDDLLDADDACSEPRTARDLTAVLPPGSVLTVASSMPVRDLNTFMRPRGGVRVLGNRGASGVDGFVSTALGVALAHDGPAYALTGDLSLLHDQNGLLLADRHAVDLVMVVANNDGGGIFSFLPQAAHRDSFERLFATPHGVPIERLAAVYGCGYRLLEQPAEAPRVVADATAQGGVQLIEVRTDRVANVALHRRIQQAVSASLAG